MPYGGGVCSCKRLQIHCIATIYLMSYVCVWRLCTSNIRNGRNYIRTVTPFWFDHFPYLPYDSTNRFDHQILSVRLPSCCCRAIAFASFHRVKFEWFCGPPRPVKKDRLTKPGTGKMAVNLPLSLLSKVRRFGTWHCRVVLSTNISTK